MNEKITAGLAAVAAGATLVLTAPVFAEGHPPPLEHGHIMLIGADPEAGTYRKCVDLAASKALGLNAHHAHIHTGRAGEALRSAGNFVIPTNDIIPDPEEKGGLPADCAGVDEWLESGG